MNIIETTRGRTFTLQVSEEELLQLYAALGCSSETRRNELLRGARLADSSERSVGTALFSQLYTFLGGGPRGT